MSEVTQFTPPHPLNTAVLFLVFNRLDTTKQVFEAIRQAKPPRLYVAADGARANKEGEAEKVQAVRDYIMQNIDWECEVKTLFRDQNLGCKYAVSGAITWFFENEKQGIILEDDCLPSQSFFWFCEELLELYKEDNRVMIISGFNKKNVWKSDVHQYFFSSFGGIWGWASWRRSWELFDAEMSDLGYFSKAKYFEYLLGKKLGIARERQMQTAPKTSWAYPWAYTRHKNSGLACVPTKSLVENIGFGEDATHTSGVNIDNVHKHEVVFPINENKYIVPDRKYDEKFIANPSFLLRVVRRLKKFL